MSKNKINTLSEEEIKKLIDENREYIFSIIKGDAKTHEEKHKKINLVMSTEFSKREEKIRRYNLLLKKVKLAIDYRQGHQKEAQIILGHHDVIDLHALASNYMTLICMIGTIS